MKPPHILIVDDEANIRFVLEHTLRHEGYLLTTAAHGVEALKKLSEAAYDLLLLDLHMEPIGGLEVLNSARQQDPDLVVIILTAYSSVESAVEALRLGAFDYLFKPATPAIIRQRVKEGINHRQQALRRRRLLNQIESLRQALDELDDSDNLQAPPRADRRFVHSGELTIDCYHRQATLGDKLLNLTTAEFDVLLALVKAAPGSLTPRQLVNQALGYDTDETEARSVIKWHIHHLRHKIEADPAQPCYIKTVRHKGYLWSGE